VNSLATKFNWILPSSVILSPTRWQRGDDKQ
jgi:hypothetical protein